MLGRSVEANLYRPTIVPFVKSRIIFDLPKLSNSLTIQISHRLLKFIYMVVNLAMAETRLEIA